jgi:hypothetical protein
VIASLCVAHVMGVNGTKQAENKQCVKRKKNISCILSFVAERILGNGISYLDLLAV